MKISHLDITKLTEKIVDKILYDGLEDSGENGDLIMVLGSQKAPEYRIPKAVDMFFANRADKLLLCGGKVQNTCYGELEEYKAMQKRASELGIPDSVLLLETKSHSTTENYELSREIIQKIIPNCKKILLVTTAYHMRRALLLAQKILPEYEFIPCPANDGSTRRETWFKTEKGTKIVHDEIMKLKYYAENGLIDNFEI